jgi:uncharacterized protein (DUF2249 family)
METESAQTLDVRDRDGEPFGDIMAALDGLSPCKSLLLVTSFEPEPLYPVLTDRGYTFESEQVDSDEWHIDIRRAD